MFIKSKLHKLSDLLKGLGHDKTHSTLGYYKLKSGLFIIQANIGDAIESAFGPNLYENKLYKDKKSNISMLWYSRAGDTVKKKKRLFELMTNPEKVHVIYTDIPKNKSINKPKWSYLGIPKAIVFEGRFQFSQNIKPVEAFKIYFDKFPKNKEFEFKYQGLNNSGEIGFMGEQYFYSKIINNIGDYARKFNIKINSKNNIEWQYLVNKREKFDFLINKNFFVEVKTTTRKHPYFLMSEIEKIFLERNKQNYALVHYVSFGSNDQKELIYTKKQLDKIKLTINNWKYEKRC